MAKKELGQAECKKIQLDILKYIDEISKENGISYFLCGGTLLGAIRHKGYIPWDDDIDVMLLRTDYMKLVKLLSTGEKYKCISMYTQEDYFYPFAKVVDTETELDELNVEMKISENAIYIDIFPIDALPNNDIERRKHYSKILKIREIYYLSLNSKTPAASSGIKFILKSMLWAFSRIKGWKYWLDKLEKLANQYIVGETKYVGGLIAGYGERETFSLDIFNAIRVPFEQFEFDIPVGYDDYLTKLYGDYIKLPPEDQRVTRHNYVAYQKIKD